MAAGLDRIDDYLHRFGESVGAEFDRLDDEGYTDIRHGELAIGINVIAESDVLLLLVHMGEPPDGAGVDYYRGLLELNFLSTGDCAFAIDRASGAVYLRALRRLEGLDYEAFESLLQNTAAIAEDMAARGRAQEKAN
ncbi:MAG: type III secretion system chaperone [Myxococcales bacterium]|nr:type III secretion system chaperone [Myxococcales bacterium]